MAEEPPELDAKVERTMKLLVKGLVKQEIFEFDIAILSDPKQRRELVSTNGKTLKSYEIGHKVTEIKKLMSGMDKRCPNFSMLLRERLNAARLEFESQPREDAAEPLLLTNPEPAEMEYGKCYPIAGSEGLAAGVQVDTTPIWNFANLHQEPDIMLNSKTPSSPDYKHRDKPIIYVAHHNKLGKALITRLSSFIAFFNVFLCLARKSYQGFLRALVRSSSPDMFKDFVADALLEPDFVSEAMMANVLATVNHLDKDKLWTGDTVTSHPIDVPSIAKALELNSGVKISFCSACRVWWKLKVNYLDLMDLISQRHIPQLPVHRNIECPLCQQNSVQSNTRVNERGFLACKKGAITKFSLNSVLTSKHYRRTIKIGPLTFRCRALIMFHKLGLTQHAIILLVPDSGKVSEIVAVDSKAPFAPLDEDQLKMVQDGHIAGYFYSRV